MLRALWLADTCDLLEDRRTYDVTTWRDSRKDFQNSGRKEDEKYPALVEVFNEKQATEYLKEGKAFTSTKHLRSLREKTFESCLKVVLLWSLPTQQKIHEWRRLNSLLVAYWAE